MEDISEYTEPIEFTFSKFLIGELREEYKGDVRLEALLEMVERMASHDEVSLDLTGQDYETVEAGRQMLRDSLAD